MILEDYFAFGIRSDIGASNHVVIKRESPNCPTKVKVNSSIVHIKSDVICAALI